MVKGVGRLKFPRNFAANSLSLCTCAFASMYSVLLCAFMCVYAYICGEENEKRQKDRDKEREREKGTERGLKRRWRETGRGETVPGTTIITI